MTGKRWGNLLGQKCVGIDPDALRGLADVADQYAQRLALTIATAGPLVTGVASINDSLTGDLAAIRRFLIERGDDLRWRATVMAMAQSMDLAAVGPLRFGRWLAEFASISLFAPSTRGDGGKSKEIRDQAGHSQPRTGR